MDIDNDLQRFEPARRYKRKSLTGEVLVYGSTRASFSEAQEISEGGMLITTTPRIQIGEFLELNFQIPGQGSVVVTGKVIYVLGNHADKKTPIQAGIKFVNLSETDAEKIRSYVGADKPKQ